MASRTFRLEAIVPVSPAEAIDFLSRLDAHRGLHPYLESADAIAQGVDDEGPCTDWRIVERPKLGPFLYTIRFPTRTIRASDTSLISRVKAAPGCTLVIRTNAATTDAGTVVAETAIVSAPAVVVGYMTRHALAAHTRTFTLLPDELHAG